MSRKFFHDMRAMNPDSYLTPEVVGKVFAIFMLTAYASLGLFFHVISYSSNLEPLAFLRRTYTTWSFRKEIGTGVWLILPVIIQILALFAGVVAVIQFSTGKVNNWFLMAAMGCAVLSMASFLANIVLFIGYSCDGFYINFRGCKLLFISLLDALFVRSIFNDSYILYASED